MCISLRKVRIVIESHIDIRTAVNNVVVPVGNLKHQRDLNVMKYTGASGYEVVDIGK